MFNAGLKKEALAELNRANGDYKDKYKKTVDDITDLQDSRMAAVNVLSSLECFIQSLANKPKEYEKIIGEIELRRRTFESEVHNLEVESRQADKVSGKIAGAGVATGVGVVALGPSAAMAIAMTFGTASTGTAIATLSGAVATNAALAWLGGGALAAGGAGMAGGEAFLAMAGPVGWAIGGAALLGGGLLANSKNKKIAEKAEASTRTVKRETERISETDIKVMALHSSTVSMNKKLNKALHHMINLDIMDYELFSEDDKCDLRSMMNTAESLSIKIGETVSQ